MPGVRVSRPAESRAVATLLASAASTPAALLLEGEAGIGKTTLLLAASDEAREKGFQVLAARAAAAESVLAYAVLADLLADVGPLAYAGLPDVQRVAVDRVLLRGGVDERPSDQREVAASFLSVVERVAEASPVLLVVDDLQWLDTSSQKAIAYAARRFKGRVGLLGGVRTEAGGGDKAAWLQMPRPDALTRITLRPLNLNGLHAVVSNRLGLSFRRPTMIRILETSAGNPLYALELARAIRGEDAHGTDLGLSSTLTELVRARIGTLDADVQELLLAAACVADPTVELVAAATESNAEDVFERLEQAERGGIVTIEGHRLRFEHPLLARGVYTGAATATRRTMHRRLAELVDQPELHARHLALAGAHGDERTLHSLDAAAEIARVRGAPATAAELLDLAAELGGDTPQRRILSARHHFNAGDAAHARALLEKCVGTPGVIAAEALTLLGLMQILEGSLADAADTLQRALDQVGDDQQGQVQILIPLALALYNSGEAGDAADRIEQAVALATHLNDPHLLSQALSMHVLLRYWLGHGFGSEALQRALDLEDTDAVTSVVTRPSMHNAMLLAFTGSLDEGHDAMRLISRRCTESGDESEQVFVAFHRVLLEIWRGELDQAAAIADDAMDRAYLLDGDLPRGVALTMHAAVAAYRGRAVEARHEAKQAMEALASSGSILLKSWPCIVLGFVEASLSHHEAALAVLKPLLSEMDPDATEIFIAAFVPDAVEALVALDRLAQADPLVEALESNGRRLDRAWMLAVGARGRAMIMAAQGDIDNAVRCATLAMVHHDALPMPFERARTQVLLGQLCRRRRQKDSATAILREALQTFDAMGAALWSDRTRAELARADVAHAGTDELTPSEQRVAELAAGGMTNRDIAAALFISPKTVETNLARVYRKLGIHSRAQLGRHVNPVTP